MSAGERGANTHHQEAPGAGEGGSPPRAEPGRTGGAAFIPLAEVQSAPSAERDRAVVRERLANARGRAYWRSLEELANTEEFQRYLKREFPLQAPREMQPLSRREFFRLMGAGLALAGVGGCAWQPAERIVPYVNQPEQLVPGKPLFYATTFTHNGYAYGVLGESHLGRPTKIEGNPKHPASLGATDIFGQASLLTLYDPDRSQAVRHLGSYTTWDVFLGELTRLLDPLRRTRGAGLRIITESFTSPTLARQFRQLLNRYPEARIVRWDPVSRENVREAARLAFGREAEPVYRFDRAQRILALDADFLTEEPGSVRYAREFADGRRVRVRGAEKEPAGAEPQIQMNRLYVVESAPTLTGANADHRLALRPSQIETFARAVATELGVAGLTGAPVAPPDAPAEWNRWVRAVTRDLQEHRGRSLVIAGPHTPPVVQALAFAINQALGNIGQTVSFIEPVVPRFGDREQTLPQLVDDLNAGRVEMLVILGGNPVYTAPAGVRFAEALQNFNNQTSNLDPQPDPARRIRKPSIHLGLYDDETGVLCQWHIPESHYLEAWSDARAYDGTASIVQPLIVPLYATRSVHELLAALLGEGDRAGYDIVREYWFTEGGLGGGAATAPPVTGAGQAQNPAVARALAQFERRWHDALLRGYVPNTAARPRNVTVQANFPPPAPPAPAGDLEIAFRPDPTIWDGRYANNAWLMELPKPLTKLTWDNAALISPATARQLGLVGDERDYRALSRANGQVVRLRFRDHVLDAAVWITPGHANQTVTLYLGHGRSRAGRVGNGSGFNAYALRTLDATWSGIGLTAERTGRRYELISAQNHFTLDAAREEDLVRTASLADFQRRLAEPPQGERGQAELPSLYPPMWPSDAEPSEDGVGVWDGKGWAKPPVPGARIPAWGMVIDLTACIGCNTCVLACQAENNIPTVGKDQMRMFRDMYWLRIDTYFRGEVDHPDTIFQPVPCMHCEKAPCEPVCPVEATSHSAEGVNEQTYNRCIGTRYCENNCPYKVRRFNYLQYSDQKTPTIQLMRNPDVTVRSRGVMEKCTYCIQRITEARIEAEKEERPLREGDVITACAQACPTRAIVFGDLNDLTSHEGQGSLVRQLKREPHHFTMLMELNTRPRTSYLARLRNPNEELEPLQAAGSAEPKVRH